MTPIITIKNISFKREDLNITGSAKDRAVPLQIENLLVKGYKTAVISSTGNAAISAKHFCEKKKIPLTIFLSPNTSKEKLQLIKDYHLTNKAISGAIKYSQKNHSFLLRQSTDPVALNAYKAIGKEILSQLPKVSSVFIAAGSGTTAYALALSMPKVPIFIVQSAFNCPLAQVYDPKFKKEKTNLTDAITVKYLPLKDKILKIVKNGVVVQNKEILLANKFLEKNKIITSLEGAAALAGYLKVKDNPTVGKHPLIILTGAKR